jgi:hypothetical protein
MALDSRPPLRSSCDMGVNFPDSTLEDQKLEGKALGGENRGKTGGSRGD